MSTDVLVRDVMVGLTQSISNTQTLIAARQRMQGDMRVKSLIVVDEANQPLGLVRYTDVSSAEAGGTVADYMVTNVPTVGPDDTLASVTGLMSEYDVDRLVVVDSSGGIVGELPREALTLSETEHNTAIVDDLAATIDRSGPAYQVAEGMSVHGSDGSRIGSVKGILSDALTNAITHIIVHTGLIFGHDKSVPADLIDAVDGEDVRLKVEKADVNALPDLEEA